MNTVTEILNNLSYLWAGQMWTIIWQSSVLAGLVVIVNLIFRRLSAAVKFWLWMLVPLRLLVMPLITISLPLLPAIAPPHVEHIETLPAMVEAASFEYSPAMMENYVLPEENFNFTPIQPLPAEVPEQKSEPAIIRIKPNLWSFLMLAWFAGVAFWTLRLLWSWRKIKHIVHGAMKTDKKHIVEQASKAAEIAGLKNVPEILVTSEKVSPFLFGILRPVLVIPSGFADNVSNEGLLAVFSHEFAHLRRRDTLVGWILAICEAFYFFHPVLHFAKRRILFERERACDDWVIASGNSHKKTYANALIDAAGICRNFSAGLAPAGVVAESFGDLKKRIIAIGSNLKPKTRLSKTALVLLVLTGTICVPGFVLTNRSVAQLQNDTNLIGGIVTDREGNTITGVKVYLYHHVSNWDFENRINQQVTSSNDGSFQFEKHLQYCNPNEFPNGNDKFILMATHQDYALGWCNIIKGQEKESYELVLTEPQSQTITVTDHEGNPLEDVRVWPYLLGNQSGPEPLLRETILMRSYVGIVGGVTDADGRAIIKNLPRTECHFNTKLKGYAVGYALPGQTRIKLSKGATIRGLVLDEEGKAVENALVKFRANWNFSQSFLTKTDSQGKFIFEDLPAEGWDMSSWGVSESATGSYVISIEHNDYITSETQDVLKPGEVKENFIIDAYRGTLVKCNVIEKDTGKLVVGARIQGSNESGNIDGYSDAGGVFSFRVFPGNVFLNLASPPKGTYVLRDDSLPSGVGLDAKGEEITFTLEVPKIAGLLTNVRGKVVLPDGSPAANLEIYTATSAYYEAGGYTGHGGTYTGTNSDGTFLLEKVPAGLKLFIYGNTKDFEYILAETINQVDDPTILPEPLVMNQGQTADVLLTDKQGNPLVNKSVKVTPKMWGNNVPRAEEHYGRTNSEGRLIINGIIPGMEYFIIDARGDRSESGWWDNYYHEERILIPETHEQVEIQTPPTALDVMNGEISGLVEDKDGNPINSAYIEILNKELVLLENPMDLGGTMRKVITENYHTQTGRDGFFRFEDLNSGKTDIVVKVKNYRTKILKDISTGTKDLKIVLDEPAAYKLSGKVTDSEGKPLKDVQVTLAQDIDKPVTNTVKTSDDGRFKFEDILEPVTKSRARMLFAQKEKFGIWGKVLDTTGGETYLEITLLSEENVSGKVIDDKGKPIAGADVILWSCTGENMDFTFSKKWQNIAPKVKTDTSGRFVLPSLPANSSLNIWSIADGYANSLELYNTGQYEDYAVSMGDGTTMVFGGNPGTEGELEFVLRKAATISGTVTYEGTKMPVEGLEVMLQSRMPIGSSEGRTDKDGRFVLKNISPGRGNLLALFDDAANNSLPEWTAAAIEFDNLKPGQTKDDLKLVLVKGGIIRGKITDSQGNPLKGIDINFYSAARPRSGAACQYTLTGEDGSWAYRFPKGEVYVNIRTRILGANWSQKNYRLNIKNGQEIKNIDFMLDRELPDNSPYR